MRSTPPPPPLSLAWLLATAIATVAPHTPHLPVWLSGLCAGVLGIRAWLVWQHASAPRQWLVVLVAIATGIGVRVEFGHFFGKDPGIALLAALLCFKLLEARTRRDLAVAVLLGFFLQLGLFLYSQTPATAALALTGTLLATTTLISLHDGNAPPASQLRTGATLLAQGVPFMLVLFVLFPRIPGPLWGLPTDAYSGMTGLSGTMSPGSISELGLSDAIAFRASFRDRPPPPAQRYWRGPVLTHFDGRTWRPGQSTATSQPGYAPTGPAYDYRLTLEPHNQSWLPALDFPAGSAAQVRYASDYRLLSNTPVRSRAQFELRAYPEAPVGTGEDPAVLADALRLPANLNPRSRALARELAAGGAAPENILARTVDRLKRSGLTYTLTPPLLARHTIDEFLFDTRLGFCEHFASTFVFLMRAAGIPARVVTGYQGGEINPYDRNLIVRQSDAHAWTEVWLAGRGWIRVDPTALSAPNRIESGLAAALSDWDALPLMMRPGLRWLRDVRYRWEALSHGWNRWIPGYNPDRQRELLEHLGFSQPDWRTLGLLSGVGGGLLMLLLVAWSLRGLRRSDPLDRAWAAFSRKLARHGGARHAWEGPADYGKRLATTFPRHASVLRDITDRYARLRYGPHAHESEVRELAQRIRRLNLR